MFNFDPVCGLNQNEFIPWTKSKLIQSYDWIKINSILALGEKSFSFSATSNELYLIKVPKIRSPAIKYFWALYTQTFTIISQSVKHNSMILTARYLSRTELYISNTHTLNKAVNGFSHNYIKFNFK